MNEDNVVPGTANAVESSHSKAFFEPEVVEKHLLGSEGSGEGT